jgi:hypothetical protein
MRLMELCRSAAVVFILLCSVPAAFAQSVAGVYGGSYNIGTSGDQITSLTNDDGSVIYFHYDSAGGETGTTVSIGPEVSLALQHGFGEDGSGWVQAGSLPPLVWSNDAEGRAASATLYPGMTFVNGEWYLDVNAADPIPVAFFTYAASGHLSEVTLDNGVSLQLGASAESNVVTQSLIRPDGTVAAIASAAGGTNGVTVVPAQLDAVATRFGLGANWAETLTFSLGASAHVTTARNASGAVQMYLVDVGPVRVGYAPDGTALFYDLTVTYTSGGISSDPAPNVDGVAPSHVVVTADGAVGLYNDRPAFGAVYSAWTETNGSSVTDLRFATIAPETSSGGRRVATNGRSRVKSHGYRRYKSTVCADGVCWDRYWYEWVDDRVYAGGGSPGGGGKPPAGGGQPAVKPGNGVKENKLRAKVDRGLNKAKAKLQNEACKALLDRIGVDNKKLVDLMNERGYADAGQYLTGYVSYVEGTTRDCPNNPMASTTVKGQRVAICSAFHNATEGMTSVYLIHEMMHTLGYGESPQIPGFPNTAEITEAVANACGRN